jgi:hypothetical protein
MYTLLKSHFNIKMYTLLKSHFNKRTTLLQFYKNSLKSQMSSSANVRLLSHTRQNMRSTSRAIKTNNINT